MAASCLLERYGFDVSCINDIVLQITAGSSIESISKTVFDDKIPSHFAARIVRAVCEEEIGEPLESYIADIPTISVIPRQRRKRKLQALDVSIEDIPDGDSINGDDDEPVRRPRRSSSHDDGCEMSF